MGSYSLIQLNVIQLFFVTRSCDSWYHYECVGLTADDDRLKPGAEFLCPPCIVHQYVAFLNYTNIGEFRVS